MRTFLLFLVSLLSVTAVSARSNGNDTVSVPEQCSRYAFEIATPKAALTGIMMMKVSEEEILGSMFNEFGVSAIDFRYDRRKDKMKLLSVSGFLNKWYIRMTLKKDLGLLMKVLFDIPYKPNRNFVVSENDNGCIIENKKRKLTYTFNRIPVPEYDT